MAVDDKPRRASVGLDDVFGLWMGVIEPRGGMRKDGVLENFVEVRSFYDGVAGGVYFESQIKKFGDVSAGLGTCEEDWGEGEKIKVDF